jgi:D-alanyl-D-alanine carboxypeptidase
MPGRRWLMVCGGVFILALLFPGAGRAAPFLVDAKSAILMDVNTGEVLFEQNADAEIPPASITKILSLYLVFEAIQEGRAHPWDKVRVSSLAARTGGSRMGLRTGDVVTLEELIKGMAIVSGNDACVAVAEYIEGSVPAFVRKMNAKAKALGMNYSVFLTPNGLPAKGQVTTARDIAKLSIAYMQRFPEALAIHSTCTYTYRSTTHHNANRLLGRCPGVDGIKTGFVCASGFNISATAKRGDTRILAVVLGAPSPGIRARETAKLINGGYHMLALAHPEEAHELEAVSEGPCVPEELTVRTVDHRHRKRIVRRKAAAPKAAQAVRSRKHTHLAAKAAVEESEKQVAKPAAEARGHEVAPSKSRHTAQTTKRSAARGGSRSKGNAAASNSPKKGRTAVESEAPPAKPIATSKAHRGHVVGEARAVSKVQETEKSKLHKKRKPDSASSSSVSRSVPIRHAHHQATDPSRNKT